MKQKIAIIAFVGAAALVSLGIYSFGGIGAGKNRHNIPTARVAKHDRGATDQSTGIVKPLVGANVKVGTRMLGKVFGLPISVMARESETSYIFKRKANR